MVGELLQRAGRAAAREVIVAFHTFLAPGNPVAWLILALEIYLAFVYRAAFRPMLRARVEAGAAEGAGAAPGKLRPAESAA
ncbi:hypothetical protein WMF38_47780 [Sorangium sp. So ce118]